MEATQEVVRAPKGVFRFSFPLTIIGILIAGLIGWTISMIPATDNLKMVAGLCAGLSSALYLLTQFNVGGSRSATVIKTTSWFVFVLSMIVVTMMAAWCTNPSYFIITMSLIALIFLVVILGVAKSGQ